MRGRHHQEPRQPGAIKTFGPALCRWRRDFGPDETVRAVIGGSGG